MDLNTYTCIKNLETKYMRRLKTPREMDVKTDQHVTLGVLDASNLLVTMELMRLIASFICSFTWQGCCYWPVLKQLYLLRHRRFRWGDEIFVVDTYIVSRGQNVPKHVAVVWQRISVFIDRLSFKYWEVCSLEHGLVVGNVARSQNSLFYHSTIPPGEPLVVFLGVDFWHNSDYSMGWGTKGGSPARGE